MKKALLFLSFAALAVASCVEPEPIGSTDVYEIKVSFPEKSGYDLYWKAGDVVSAGMNNLSNPLANVPSSARTASFTFSKAITDGAIVRYPGKPNPTTLSIPATQMSAAGQLDPESFMFYGKASVNAGSEPSIVLKNVMAMIKFSIKGEKSIVKARLEPLAGEPINGVFNVSKTGFVTNVSKASSYTEITFEQPLTLDANNITDLYMAVPPATYSKGFTLRLYEDDKNYMMVMFLTDGSQLDSQSLTQFNLIYSGGYMVTLNPDEDFGSGTLSELEAGPLFGEFSAQGKIVYDDGQPAAGIKVSDGFNVVVTDEQGKYAFKAAGYDVRYIYFTYPSDARVTVSADGCPEFYQKYEPGKFIYDFTLKRQPVESEFVVFALADPQTHYAKRDTQTMPDTDRFGNETVPALNTQIAKQTLPCYGISLGDITYSEGSRDSTPSMKVIRGHFARVNMPIFNVMGNHDYTYYKTDATVSANTGSSTINLVSQRSFEDVFGPINYSFDRGNIHFVCMKDIYFNSTSKWDASDYSGGFTNEEYNWLVKDLENTPKTMKVILCVHIPISTASGPKLTQVRNLLNKYNDSVIFSGHTHYQRTVYQGSRLYEQIHSAVCGQWWWSKIEGDGCPNGYTIYYFNNSDIKDYHFMGVNEGMNTRDYQMRIYKGNLLTGGKYAKFQLPHSENEYLINVFNGDEMWDIKVYENGVYAGKADLIPASKWTTNTGSSGKTLNPASTSSQDWWAIGYHIGYCKRGTSGTSYQTANYHMWKWTVKDPSAKISVEAVDPYGNVYTCDQIVTDGQNYPDNIKIPLSIF